MIFLEPDEVPKLEKTLQKDPNDLRTRLQLINYYLRENADEVLVHIIWLIANKPETDFEHHKIWVGAKFVDAVDEAWAQAIEREPNNVTILRNAISCCGMLSRDAAKTYLARGYQIDPSNEEWPRELSQLFYLETLKEPPEEEVKQNAIKSIQFGKEALELYKQFPKDGYFKDNLGGISKRHAELCFRFDWLQDAQYFGEYLVEHGHAQQRTWDGNAISLLWHVSDVHLGHSILGRIALRKKDIEQVLFHLARMPFYVSLDFHPDMVFAQELLDSGRIETVCAYLDDCIKHFSTILDLMIEEGSFYDAVLHDHDMPMDGSGYILNNLRQTISKFEEWKISIRDGQKIKLTEYI